MIEIRLDHLLGRPVVGMNGRRVGRLEECRVHRDGNAWAVVEYEIGASGLWERLGLGARLVLGLKAHGYRVRWNQITITDSGPLRLTCPISELRRV